MMSCLTKLMQFRDALFVHAYQDGSNIRDVVFEKLRLFHGCDMPCLSKPSQGSRRMRARKTMSITDRPTITDMHCTLKS